MAPIALTCQASQIVQPAFSTLTKKRDSWQAAAAKPSSPHARCIHPIEASLASKRHCPLRTEKPTSLKARTRFGSRNQKRKVRTVALLKPFISQATTDKTIQLPINYYQVLQAGRHLLPEKIARAYEARIREVPGDGAPYSKAALAAREELLLVKFNNFCNLSSCVKRTATYWFAFCCAIPFDGCNAARLVSFLGELSSHSCLPHLIVCFSAQVYTNQDS